MQETISSFQNQEKVTLKSLVVLEIQWKSKDYGLQIKLAEIGTRRSDEERPRAVTKPAAVIFVFSIQDFCGCKPHKCLIERANVTIYFNSKIQHGLTLLRTNMAP